MSCLWIRVLSFLLFADVFYGDIIGNNPICENIDNESLNMGIRTAFVYKKFLYLLTYDWMVYKVPYMNFANTYGKMYFNVTPVKMEEMWPGLGTNYDFQHSKGDADDIYYLKTSKDFIFFDGLGSSGFMYPLDDGWMDTTGVKIKYRGKVADITEGSQRYSINYESNTCFDEILILNKWKYEYNMAWGYVTSASIINTYYMYYAVNKDHPENRDIITITYNLICGDETEKFFGEETNLKLIPIDDWDVPPGFIYNSYFHFFDRNKIYLFEKKLYDDSEIVLNSTFTIIPAKDFFICNHIDHKLVPITYPPITTNTLNNKIISQMTINESHTKPKIFVKVSDKADKNKMIIYGLSAAVLIALLGGLLYIANLGKKSKHPAQSKHSKHQKNSKQNLDRMQKMDSKAKGAGGSQIKNKLDPNTSKMKLSKAKSVATIKK